MQELHAAALQTSKSLHQAILFRRFHQSDEG